MFCQDKNAYETFKDDEKMQRFCEGYKTFLNSAKTEREAAKFFIKMAAESGFRPFDKNSRLRSGDKVFIENRDKSVIFAVIGNRPIQEGVNLIAAHIDSPRLDLKQNPLYEEIELALLKTHYYGGIKKYQWTAIPLALHGVVVTENGVVDINIGEAEEDPVFTVPDLLPHLARKQMDKKMAVAVEGEELTVLCGGVPMDIDKKKVKANVLDILKNKFGIVEEDFISAELEVVPAFKAQDIGFDRSFVGGYGQDDRVCAYTAFLGLTNVEIPDRTAVLLLADKEEVGSMGCTGMKSHFFEDTMAVLANATTERYSDLLLREVLGNSDCLSADVGAAIDPNHKGVQDAKNAPKLNHGVLLTKYTGSRGKAGSSDASAEFVGQIRKLFNNNDIAWQIGELGKVDEGGGGTVAQYIANLNINVVDVGVPLLSMHSPFEVAAKIDIYMAYRAYSAFLGGGI